MMIAANEEHRDKEKIIKYRQQEENIVKTIYNHRINHVSYGLMSYDTYYIQDTLLSNYHILHTTRELYEIINYTKRHIINNIKTKNKVNLLLYNVINVDPKLVSYQFITSSNFQWLQIIIKNKTNLCQFYGNTELHKSLYDSFYFLKDYNSYKNKLTNLSKKDLKKIYYDIYNRKPIFLSKNTIIKWLLKRKLLSIH